VNLVEVHLAVLVYSLLEANLLDAIVHVIVSNDTFLSVRATILLGKYPFNFYIYYNYCLL
jgi:rapamycin-insensitive companion of mTOR